MEKITFDKRNYRRHDEKNKRVIRKSLEELGAGRSVVIDKEGALIAGNGVYEQAQKLKMPVRVVETDGSELVVVKRTDLATGDEKRKKLALADNVASDLSDFDNDLLQEDFTIEQLSDWGLEFEIQTDTKEAQEDDFDEEKDKVETVCKKGDIWQLGNHRLMCGDSTDPNNFARLMDGNIADIAFTSPPYGVNDGSIRKHQEKGKSDHSAKNFYLEHDDNMGTWPSLVEETWQRMHENSKQQFINIQMLADNKRELLQWAARHADHFVDMLIWNKVNAAPQMQPNVVNNVYENIYVFGEKDATRKLEFGAFRGNQSAIIEVRVGNNEYSDIHKAVFPVALPAAILNINSKAKSVLDCFGGTGTTMIAAEQLGRKCYMMELDQHYCDVIIARWEKLTGQKATKIV